MAFNTLYMGVDLSLSYGWSERLVGLKTNTS